VTGSPPPSSPRVPRQKKSRRTSPSGRRRWPETDALTPIADDELHEIERTFARLRDLEPVHRKDADTVVRLVAEVRRLRQLALDANQLVKFIDSMSARPVVARLKAEAERNG
jgi:hypothetical protein